MQDELRSKVAIIIPCYRAKNKVGILCKQLIKIASQSNLILGDGQKRIQPSEYLVINTQRKSLYAAKNLKVGDKLSLNKIIVKGPGGGILPKYISLIENRIIRKPIKKDHPITWENI